MNSAVDQIVRMEPETLDYARLSEDEMAAAARAASLEECQAHLERAVRYASLACLTHQQSPDFNEVEIWPGVRRQSSAD